MFAWFLIVFEVLICRENGFEFLAFFVATKIAFIGFIDIVKVSKKS